MKPAIKRRITFIATATIAALAFAAMASAGADAPRKVPGEQQAKKLVNKVSPVYPPEAKQKGQSGKVKLQALINADGTVKDLKVLSGDEVFIPNTLEAVRQWTWEPTVLNGKPVEVITEIEVNFTLSQ